jgi:hypothetical protein
VLVLEVVGSISVRTVVFEDSVKIKKKLLTNRPKLRNAPINLTRSRDDKLHSAVVGLGLGGKFPSHAPVFPPGRFSFP